MRPARLIAALTALAAASAVARAEDVAVSLVHPQGRIDVVVSQLLRVEAKATGSLRNKETGEIRELQRPRVDLCFTKDVKERICELTRKIVGQPMEIVIDCTTVERPVVREPLCTSACFSVSAADIADANALAQRIRRGTNRACAPSS